MMVTRIKSDNNISVKTEENREEDDGICELEHLRKLFIGGLAPYTTEESLKEFYGQYGKVVDVVVMRDPASKRSRGFGFITYTKSSMVDKAQENRPHIVDGKTVEAKRALPRPERESRESNLSVKKLFVGGLKDNHDEQCLEEYFSEFGHVVSVKILTDKTSGKRRGFAFIEFDDYDSVDKAILQKTHSIKYVLVDVKKSVYKHENRNQNNNNGGGGSMNMPKQDAGVKPNTNMQNNYRGGPMQQQPPMAPYPQQPPMNGGAPPPPANYNYWGPPQTQMQPPYGGYQPPPPQGQMNTWNYPPAQPWNPGQPPAGPQWYPPNQWGGPPPASGVPPPVAPVPPGVAPPPAAPPVNWAGPPQVAPVQAPPPVAVPAPNGIPPAVPVAAPPQQAPPQQQPPNFGAGYQQSYGGGPSKNNNMHQNRMNPYGPPGPNNYVNNGQPNNGAYSGYNANIANGKPGPITSSNNVAITGANKYRR